MVFPPTGELSAVSWSGFNIFTISLSESLLSHISRRSGLPEFGDLTKNREVVTASSTFMMELRRLLHQIISMGERNDKTENSDALYARLEYLMPKMILSILESARYHRKAFSRRRAKTLSQAEEIIRDRIDEPLTVHKLSLLTGVTERALHYAFMEKYGVSPKAYLQATRFNVVRREIRNADPHRTKVTDIANRWGFWHMGQFAKDYRKFFGELPSETLVHS
jgi:AraC family ethanolamine operon transcriptional activator